MVFFGPRSFGTSARNDDAQIAGDFGLAGSRKPKSYLALMDLKP
jgi:hypothetical protein